MALPTTTEQQHSNAQRQAATPGVGLQGAPPVVAPVEAAKPVLFEDIDPVLLIRLYPGAKDAAELRAQAMAAGAAAYEQGATLMAAQQEPVVVLDEAGVPIVRPGERPAPVRGAPQPQPPTMQPPPRPQTPPPAPYQPPR